MPSISDIIGTFYTNLDQQIARDPTTWACKRGCAWCCYGRVAVTLAEAAIIADHIRDQPELIQAVDSYIEQSRNLGVLHSVPCPFLGQSRDCRIYERRPLSCRTHHSKYVFSCASPSRIAMTSDYIRDLKQTAMTALTKSISKALSRGKLAARWVDLAGAVQVALAHPDTTARMQRGDYRPFQAAKLFPLEN